MYEKEQAKVDTKVIYLAGLFEGEGCAYIGRHKAEENKTGYQYQARISIKMSDYEPVKAFYDYFGDDIHSCKSRANTNWRIQYKWEVSGKKASDIAKELIPHILTPRKQGALQCVIDLAKTLTNGGHPLNREIWQKREDLYNKCRTYNARGINANNRLKHNPPKQCEGIFTKRRCERMETRKVFKQLMSIQMKVEPQHKEALTIYARRRKMSTSAVVREWIEKEIIGKEQ